MSRAPSARKAAPTPPDTAAESRIGSRAPEVVRERILDAAEAVFLEHGYTAASTNDVLAHFGGSKATLFKYFPTKQDLFLSVCDRVRSRLVTPDAGAPPVLPEDPREGLSQLAHRVVRFVFDSQTGADHQFIRRVLMVEGEQFPELRQSFYQSGPARVHAMLTVWLQQWCDAGRLRSDDVKIDAATFLDMIDGMVLRYSFISGSRTPRKAIAQAIDNAVDVFLGGRSPS